MGGGGISGKGAKGNGCRPDSFKFMNSTGGLEIHDWLKSIDLSLYVYLTSQSLFLENCVLYFVAINTNEISSSIQLQK